MSSLTGSSTMAAADTEKAESTAESARVLAEAIRARLPVVCDLKPSGRFVTTDSRRP